MDSNTQIQVLEPQHLSTMTAMPQLFEEVFEDPTNYGAKPSAAYLERLLASDTFIAIAVLEDKRVVAGLAAYELRKFEQERSEIYIYDLAVAESHRRRGLATALIERPQEIAAGRGAWVIFVQADYGDDPAVALYTRLGTREDVMHFDIPVPRKRCVL